MLVVKSTVGLKVKTRPRYRGNRCRDCIMGRRSIEECKLGLNDDCKEQIMVFRTLNPTGQRLYWVLRELSDCGEKKVAIRDTDMAKLINTTTRTLFINSKILEAWDMISTEILSHAGKRVSLPRKCYTFMGAQDGNRKVE